MLSHYARRGLIILSVLWCLAPAILLAGDGGAPQRLAAPPALRFTAERPGLPLLPPNASLRQMPPDRGEETPGHGSRAIFFAFLCLSLIPILSLAVAFALKRRFDTLGRQRRASGKYRSPNTR
ncbi:MAG: leucine-rich single-pass membrane protein 1 [Chloroflexaceae bacterium]|nr:leucine-rich single-pass membrane protein 1 [Chloroflexaceae bacterium]